jgi:CzcA family heavy metal efflux pump
MLDLIIKFSLKHRLTVLIMALIVLAYGTFVALNLPVDVFPDLNRPVITVMTDGHGLAPEEVETLITIPIETALNGTTDVVRIRSSSGMGISIIYVEFEWGTDLFRNRQLVSERLQLAKEKLPKDLTPVMMPTSSIMGEIMFVGLTSPTGEVDAMELRTLAEWILRPRLLAITGISQVVVMGGDLKQFQILLNSEKLQRKGLSIEDLQHSLSEISENSSGGFIDIDKNEYLIRTLGRVQSKEEIENSYVGLHLGNPVYIKDIAEVKIGANIKRGTSSVNARPSVIMTIQKQPTASTIDLTQKIEKELAVLQKSLPQGVIIKSDLFKQSHFIESSINNVKHALRDGAIMVAIILFMFLLNIRTTLITLTAIPLSFVATALVFKYFGFSVNTMTLGGLAVAIGELVDDAIVDVENVFRRLRENKLRTKPENSLRVIFQASSEVRNSIVISTMIVVLVFIPLFALDGIEGRLFAPLGYAYIISLLASLVISLTVTPAMCSFLLPNSKSMEHPEGKLVQFLKHWDEKIIRFNIKHPKPILALCFLLVAGAIALIPLMGRNFLPEFNEGSATIGVASKPGISLPENDALGTAIEKELLKIPEIQNTVRRLGRAEMDEHAEGVHWNEIDVDFKKEGREREIVLKEIRAAIERAAPGAYMNIGQPISHRLDHLLSGVRAQIAIKIFGPDMTELRRLGAEVEEQIGTVTGVVDLQLEPLVLVPQLKIQVDQDTIPTARMPMGKLAIELENTLLGEVVGRVIEGQRSFNIYMKLDDESRNSPEKIGKVLLKILPDGKRIHLQDVANIYQGKGPNMINRENMQRRIIVSANASGRDLNSIVTEMKKIIEQNVKLPQGYFIEYGGQFEGQIRATKMLMILGSISLLIILFILYTHFHSFILSLQVMLNIPLALIGSVVAIYLTEKVLSVATLVAFITLCGIASRNGIMMITHYLHLMKEEGEQFSEQMIIRGSLERLVPVLMTALTAGLALIPLLMARGEPGKEILYPVAVVIVGGLITSTILDIMVTPVVFYHFGKKAANKWIINEHKAQEDL